ncbi:hypothetical protein LY78DRAFT_188130 [Colletotrichum sublineola]|nr:hypothetical protein LY78DRAFT_188130 [Colletotrichum sublineola]
MTTTSTLRLDETWRTSCGAWQCQFLPCSWPALCPILRIEGRNFDFRYIESLHLIFQCQSDPLSILASSLLFRQHLLAPARFTHRPWRIPSQLTVLPFLYISEPPEFLTPGGLLVGLFLCLLVRCQFNHAALTVFISTTHASPRVTSPPPPCRFPIPPAASTEPAGLHWIIRLS